MRIIHKLSFVLKRQEYVLWDTTCHYPDLMVYSPQQVPTHLTLQVIKRLYAVVPPYRTARYYNVTRDRIPKSVKLIRD